MISLDQVILLEQKVESAVEKIQQLKEENAALRKQCSELTNALSSKSEQLSSFENDQNQIENGIKKALDRLNSIENSVLKAASENIIVDDQIIPTPQFNKPTATFQDLEPVTKQQTVIQHVNEIVEPVIIPETNPINQFEPEETPQDLYTSEIPEDEGNSFFEEAAAFEETGIQMDDSQELPEQLIDEQKAENAFNNEMFQQEEPEYEEGSEDISEGQTSLGFDIF